METPDLTILAEGPFTPDAIDITWAPAPAISLLAQAYIDERWAVYLADAVATGRSLFNAPVTQLMSALPTAGRLALTLGPTDYKTFVVTTLRDRPWFRRHAPAAMTLALGNSVLLTHGDHALLGIRSLRTSAYGGRSHLIGGVLDILGADALPQSIDGLLAHLRKEMLEEALVTVNELQTRPTLLVVARDEYLTQPELIWQWEVATELSTVGRRLDVEEHDGFTLLDLQEPSDAVLLQMTPVARAAHQRWKKQHG